MTHTRTRDPAARGYRLYPQDQILDNLTAHPSIERRVTTTMFPEDLHLSPEATSLDHALAALFLTADVPLQFNHLHPANAASGHRSTVQGPSVRVLQTEGATTM